MYEMYELLRSLSDRPEPFSVGGPRELWTDPHVQEQMLRLHLDPEVSAASRPHRVIERSVAWIRDAVGVDARTRVLDLGCGPGLYADPLAGYAERVDGIDLSATAVREARRRASSPSVHYTVGDYLTVDLPEHDVALLLMCDLCALSPSDRAHLLRRVRAVMAPGGRFLLDAYSRERFAQLRQGCVLADRLMDGFWAPGEYVGIHQTLLYDQAHVALDRYAIVEPDRSRIVHAWLAHLTVEELSAELADAGFTVVQVLGDATGAPFDATSPEFAVLAAPDVGAGRSGSA